MKKISMTLVMLIAAGINGATCAMHRNEDKGWMHYQARQRAEDAAAMMRRVQDRQQQSRDHEAYRIIQRARKNNTIAIISPSASLSYQQMAKEHNNRVQIK